MLRHAFPTVVDEDTRATNSDPIAIEGVIFLTNSCLGFVIFGLVKFDCNFTISDFMMISQKMFFV